MQTQLISQIPIEALQNSNLTPAINKPNGKDQNIFQRIQISIVIQHTALHCKKHNAS